MQDSGTRLDRIRKRLQEALHPEQFELIDESHQHAGHAGAQDGRGHFRLFIVAGCFAGLKPLARHQLIYQTLGDLMQTDIHALSITAVTPEENLA